MATTGIPRLFSSCNTGLQGIPRSLLSTGNMFYCKFIKTKTKKLGKCLPRALARKGGVLITLFYHCNITHSIIHKLYIYELILTDGILLPLSFDSQFECSQRGTICSHTSVFSNSRESFDFAKMMKMNSLWSFCNSSVKVVLLCYFFWMIDCNWLVLSKLQSQL